MIVDIICWYLVGFAVVFVFGVVITDGKIDEYRAAQIVGVSLGSWVSVFIMVAFWVIDMINKATR